MAMISELSEGQRVRGQFLVGSSSKGTNASGSLYLNVELRDASGTISAKKWEVFEVDEKIFQAGNIVLIEGEVIKYKDALQMKIIAACEVDENDIDVAKFVKAPPVPKEELVKNFNYYVDSIKNEDCSKILHYMIEKNKDKLYDYPAGVSVHHDYSSGLLMHITSMAKLGDFLASNYPEVDRDLLITGILLHDFGKLIELEGPAVFHYTLEGRLLGHISLMVASLREAANVLNITSEVPVLLEHMILSHHNQPEFGSPIPPLTKEALLLTMIDNLDSKMVILEKAYEGVEPGEFTQRIYPLDNRSFYKKK